MKWHLRKDKRTDSELTEMVRRAICKAATYKAQFRRVRSPGSPMFSSKCTIPTSLVQAISPLSFHTCYKFCAFFHPSGQVALLLDLGDNAFHNPPRQGVNCRSTWDTKQDTARQVRIRVSDQQVHSLGLPIKIKWKLIGVRLRKKRCSFKSNKRWWKNLNLILQTPFFVPPWLLIQITTVKWLHFLKFPAAITAL